MLRRARPAIAQASTLAEALPPVSDTLDKSADNVIAILENWSRAIQFRDQLGHVFRGEASFSPDLILSMVDRLTKPKRSKRQPRQRAAAPKPAPVPAAAPKPADKPAPAARKPLLPPQLQQTIDELRRTPAIEQVDQLVDDLVDGLLPPQQRTPETLLDYLLGP